MIIDDKNNQEQEGQSVLEPTEDTTGGDSPAAEVSAESAESVEQPGGVEASQTDSEDDSKNDPAAEQSAESQSAAIGSDEDSPEVSDDDSDLDGEVVFSSNQEESLIDDPMGEAYDLEHGSRLEDPNDPTALPWQTDVGSAKEFFSTEILYRYDILEEQEQQALRGSYRVELRGNNGGVWTINVGDELNVENSKSDAEIVISMQQRDFLNLINGQLNPQLAVLGQKMKIEGDLRRALAFQHILTPNPE